MVHTAINTQKSAWGFRSMTFWLASFIASGIISLGINGMLHPADAAAGFGIPLHNVSEYVFRTQRICKEKTMTTRPRADESRTVAIAGANGLVGRHLVEALQASGDRVIALVRQPSAHHFPSAVETRRWQASDPVAPVDGADAVVNLVGDPIFARPWSQARKQELTQTRLLATRSLVEGIRKIGGEGCTFISSTAVEYAGDTGDRQVNEKAAPGTGGFLAEMAQVWEAEAQRVRETGARLVLLRQSLVLGREGGTLASLLPLYRSGFGGTLGPGGQWFSWIHINDAARLILHALDQETITGPFISASPNPVTSREFAKTFAHTLHRPRLFPMSRGMMKLMWRERADLFLDSHRTVPQVALSTGFQFRFPTLAEALSDLLGPHPIPIAQLMQEARSK